MKKHYSHRYIAIIERPTTSHCASSVDRYITLLLKNMFLQRPMGSGINAQNRVASQLQALSAL